MKKRSIFAPWPTLLALSVGYSRLVSPRASVRIGAAFADGDNAAGVGFNVGW